MLPDYIDWDPLAEPEEDKIDEEYITRQFNDDMGTDLVGRRFLSAYLDPHSPSYNNPKESARIADPQCPEHRLASRGAGLKQRLRPVIARWMEEEGLDSLTLRSHLVALLHATKTKFFQFQGEVITRETVAALDIRLKALDMAFKVTDEYAPERKAVTVDAGKTLSPALREKLDEIYGGGDA